MNNPRTTIRGRLQPLLSYSAQDWLLFTQAWFLLLGVDLALRLLPYRTVYNRLGSLPRAQKDVQIDETIKRSSASVSRAAHYHLYRMTCLRRSLALQWLLSKRGIQTELHFGVRRKAENLHAHAWLEYNGEPIGETISSEEPYKPLNTNRAAR